MKVKKFRKKLTFSKQTIAHLSNVEINDVRGGGPTEPFPPTVLLSVCAAFTCVETIVHCCPTINTCR